MERLDGKVAVVTGGSRGIGFATAQGLLAAGARVVVSATTDEGAERAAGLLGARAVGVRADMRLASDVEHLLGVAASAFGGLDILVNNAGVGVFEPVEQTTPEQWHQVLDTNLTGVFHATRLAIPQMRARGGGWIINISSLAGRNPFANGAVYCASKAALNAFSEAVMQEVRHDGIRVASVLPGSVRTGFMGRAGAETSGADDWKLAPEDVAQVVLDLLRHPSRSLPSLVEIRPSRPPRRG